MSTSASAGTTGSPSSFGWERGWFAIRSWRSLSMLAIESRFLPYTGVVIGRQRAGYLSLSSSWLRERGREMDGNSGRGYSRWQVDSTTLFDQRTASRSSQSPRVTPCPTPCPSQTSHGLPPSQQPRCFSPRLRPRRAWHSPRLKIRLNIWMTSKKSGIRK